MVLRIKSYTYCICEIFDLAHQVTLFNSRVYLLTSQVSAHGSTEVLEKPDVCTSVNWSCRLKRSQAFLFFPMTASSAIYCWRVGCRRGVKRKKKSKNLIWFVHHGAFLSDGGVHDQTNEAALSAGPQSSPLCFDPPPRTPHFPATLIKFYEARWWTLHFLTPYKNPFIALFYVVRFLVMFLLEEILSLQ